MSFSSTVTFAVALILEYIVIFDLIIVFNSVPLVPIFLSTILLLFSYSACSLSIRYIYIYIYIVVIMKSIMKLYSLLFVVLKSVLSE